MLQKRKNILMAASSAVAAVVLVLTLVLSILPRVFADAPHITAVTKIIEQSDSPQTYKLTLEAAEDMELYALEGTLALHETTDSTSYFTLTSMEYTEAFDARDVKDNEVSSTLGVGHFEWISGDGDGVEIPAGGMIWEGVYTVAAGAPVGTYKIPVTDINIVTTGTGGGSFTEGFNAEVLIAEGTEQDISYADTAVTKTYGDAAFTNPLTETVVKGEISFASSDTTVATVDELGEVTIVGVGETTITATAAASGTYKEAKASYTLTVEKQALSIVSATVPGKTYDGTTDAAWDATVTLSDSSLVQGTDYTVTAVLADANAGTTTATVTVTLDAAFADLYDFSTTTYEVTGVVITPLALDPSNVSLEYDVARYDGTAKEPAVTVKIGEFVVDPSEYAVTYADNVNVGTAEVTVTATGPNITGYANTTFIISAKEVLEVSGIADQDVMYTGSPVRLDGTLTVAPNPAGITADDFEVKWYAADGHTEIEQPTNAGSYRVVYSYADDDYEGILVVNFKIGKAMVGMPDEVKGFQVPVGTALSAIPGERTLGFYWDDAAATVIAGANTYKATYIPYDDADNYETQELTIPVYGLTVVNVNASADGTGGAITYPTTAIEGETVDIEIIPDTGYELAKITLNGFDVTSTVEDNKLSIVAGTTDWTIVASFRKVYNVTEGAGSNYVIGEKNSAKFVVDADYSLFSGLFVDGALVDPEWYTVESGSTVITLSYEYLRAMSEGSHVMTATFSDGGVARASFTLASASSSTDDGSSSSSEAKVPDTGRFTGSENNGAAAGGIVAIVAAATSLAGVLYFIKRKFVDNKVDFNK